MNKHNDTGGTEGARMSARDARNFVELCESNGIDVWLDGGWGVDALLGKQTREHEDLDIVLQGKDVSRLRGLLDERGFKDAPWYDSHPWVFLMEDSHGHQIDLHVIELDSNGDGLYGPPDGGVRYPAESLAGMGSIDGTRVRCISPEWQVRFHAGYKLDENDHRDLQALCDRFGIPFPESIPEEGTRWQALKRDS